VRPGTILERRAPLTDSTPEGRPVILATLGVPFEPSATEVAVDTAVETGQPLIVVNATRLEPLPLSVMLGYDALEELTPDVTAALRRPAELARSLGVHVERLRIRSPRPLTALAELAEERRPGLLVFGPDRRVMKPRNYQRALASIRRRATCLVWVVPDRT
jgi:nucleotide-binding universal stress UspA family protein